MKVEFKYYSSGEQGSDSYRFSNSDEAMEKFASLSEIIKVQFEDCPSAEIVDEPDFFGIIDHNSGDWARVTIENSEK